MKSTATTPSRSGRRAERRARRRKEAQKVPTGDDISEFVVNSGLFLKGGLKGERFVIIGTCRNQFKKKWENINDHELFCLETTFVNLYALTVFWHDPSYRHYTLPKTNGSPQKERTMSEYINKFVRVCMCACCDMYMSFGTVENLSLYLNMQ